MGWAFRKVQPFFVAQGNCLFWQTGNICRGSSTSLLLLKMVVEGICHLKFIGELELYRNSNIEFYYTLDFVKIIPRENANFDFALRKRLFCIAKQPLLPCKTYAFATQNNRFYKTLIASRLHNSCACEKYLQLCSLLFVCEASCLQ